MGGSTRQLRQQAGNDIGGLTPRPLRICFPFAGGAIGGSHISAVNLILGLDRSAFEPLVVLHRATGPLVKLLTDNGIAFELAPLARFIAPGGGGTLRRLSGAPSLVLQLARFLRSRNIQIVHTNDGPMHATWSLATRLVGAKLLWHHRGNPGATGLRYLAPWLANRVVAVSDYAAPRRGLISAAARCTVVRSPFKAPSPTRVPVSAALRLQLGVSKSTRILGFFGNFTDRKRPLVFVEAIAAMMARDPDLDIVGLMFGDVLDPGLDVAVAERARHLGVADRVRIMGFRTPPEPWIELCDLLVVTAVEEPFGRTLIEAMMLGTPVIAAASGGNLEAIRDGETGVLVTPDDPRGFAEAALSLLGDPVAAAALADTAQREALVRYGIDEHVRSISEIYRQLAA